MSAPLRVIIVDDELLARRGIAARLDRLSDVVVVAEAGDAPSGITAIRQHVPDLIFLDIEMPGADGFAVLEALPEHERPLVVFVTAHDDRALQAFSVQALDYLLKPVDDAQLLRSLDRARARLAVRTHQPIERILVRDRGRVVPLEPSSIDWVQSDGDYVRVYAGRRTFLHLATISAFSEELPAHQFVRIHRAAVVNVERISELIPLTNGDYTVLLTTGARLKLTRTRRHQLAERLGKSL